MNNYWIGDFLIRVKNASMAKRDEVSIRETKLIKSVANVLKKEGFLREVKAEKGVLTASLAFAHKQPVLMGLKLVSKPGLRIYMGSEEIGKKRILSSILIISTPKGVMSSNEAKKLGIGGEVIAEVW